MPHQNLGLLRVDAPRGPPTVTIILAFPRPLARAWIAISPYPHTVHRVPLGETLHSPDKADILYRSYTLLHFLFGRGGESRCGRMSRVNIRQMGKR
jgi:hypothetical protein